MTENLDTSIEATENTVPTGLLMLWEYQDELAEGEPVILRDYQS